MEADGDAVNFFKAAGDEAGGEINALGDLDAVDVDEGVVAALAEDIDEHGEGGGVVEERILGIHVGTTGDGVPDDDGHDLAINKGDDLAEEFRVLEHVGVEAFYEFLAGVHDDLARDGDDAEAVVGGGVELEGALVLELVEDVALDLGEVALGVDEVVVENLLEGLEGVPRLLLEDAVAALGEDGIVVGGAFFPEFAVAGAADLVVVDLGFAAAFELTLDGGLFVHEEHHHVHGGLAEMDAEGGADEFATEALHAIDEEFQALDLDLGAGEAVEDTAVAVFGFEELAEEDADDLAVADHHAGVFDFAGFGRVEQGADDDGRASEAAGFEDELGLRAFTGAGGAAEEDEFFGETERLGAEGGEEIGPHGVKDQGGVLDFEVARFGGGWAGGIVGHGGAGN